MYHSHFHVYQALLNNDNDHKAFTIPIREKEANHCVCD
jgi:hypothetical protein